MMVFLPLDTWIRLIVWMMIGLDLYLFYGMKKSHLNPEGFSVGNYRTVAGTGIGLTGLLVIVAFVHRAIADDSDALLFYFSMVFALVHALGFLYSYLKKRV